MILACSDSMPSYIDTATKYILSYPLKSNPRCPLVCLNPSNQFLPSLFARRLQVPLRCWSVIRFTSHRFRTMILNIRCLTTPAFPLPTTSGGRLWGLRSGETCLRPRSTMLRLRLLDRRSQRRSSEVWLVEGLCLVSSLFIQLTREFIA